MEPVLLLLKRKHVPDIALNLAINSLKLALFDRHRLLHTIPKARFCFAVKNFGCTQKVNHFFLLVAVWSVRMKKYQAHRELILKCHTNKTAEKPQIQ